MGKRAPGWPAGRQKRGPTHLLSSPSMYSFFRRRLSWADCLFRIFLRTFLRTLSSACGPRVCQPQASDPLPANFPAILAPQRPRRGLWAGMPSGETRYLGERQVRGQGDPFLPQKMLLLICQEQGLTGQLAGDRRCAGRGSSRSQRQGAPLHAF